MSCLSFYRFLCFGAEADHFYRGSEIRSRQSISMDIDLGDELDMLGGIDRNGNH